MRWKTCPAQAGVCSAAGCTRRATACWRGAWSRCRAFDPRCAWGGGRSLEPRAARKGRGILHPRRRRRPARTRQTWRATDIGRDRRSKARRSRIRVTALNRPRPWPRTRAGFTRRPSGTRPAMPTIPAIALVIAIIAAAIIARVAIIGAIAVAAFRRDAACEGEGQQTGKHEHFLHGHDSQMRCSSWIEQ